MAKACKCDRCGSYYDPYEAQVSESFANRMSMSTSHVNGIILTWTPKNQFDYSANAACMDLCPVCMDYILSQLTMSPIPKEELITNGDIYRSMMEEYPFMHPEDWRPEGAMKIRVWGNGHVYIYDYNTKKLYEVGELE